MLSLSYDFFYPEIYDTADEHIIDVIVKVFARNSILIKAVVDSGPQLDSYKFKKSKPLQIMQTFYFKCNINVLWMVVLQQLII